LVGLKEDGGGDELTEDSGHEGFRLPTYEGSLIVSYERGRGRSISCDTFLDVVHKAIGNMISLGFDYHKFLLNKPYKTIYVGKAPPHVPSPSDEIKERALKTALDHKATQEFLDSKRYSVKSSYIHLTNRVLLGVVLINDPSGPYYARFVESDGIIWVTIIIETNGDSHRTFVVVDATNNVVQSIEKVWDVHRREVIYSKPREVL